MRVALLLAIVLYAFLPEEVVPGPRYVLPAVEGALLVVLAVISPRRRHGALPHARVLAIVLVAIVSIANIVNLGLLVRELIRGGGLSGRTLIFSAIDIWVTNVIAFGFWYWELDAGGPVERTREPSRRAGRDFLFPQQATPQSATRDWRPLFFDYLYTSFTNATAFSPTDTMPLSKAAKLLFMAQSAASLLTVALVAGRAVNILN